MEQMTESLQQLLAGNYQIEHRMMLNAQVFRDGQCIADVSALNDLVVTKGALSRIIKMELYLNEQLVERYHGDGLIFFYAYRFYRIFVVGRRADCISGY